MTMCDWIIFFFFSFLQNRKVKKDAYSHLLTLACLDGDVTLQVHLCFVY